jgi:hypothetical protein
MRHLKNIADKRGDGKAAETAERVANGEFKSTFDAYLEVKAPEPERNALSALSAALEAVGKIDPQAAAQEARTASEAAARARECARAQSILKTAEQALVRREQDLRSLAIRNAGRG